MVQKAIQQLKGTYNVIVCRETITEKGMYHVCLCGLCLFFIFFLDGTVRYMTDDEEKCLAEGKNAENTFAAIPTKLEIMLRFYKEVPLYRASLAKEMNKSPQVLMTCLYL